MSYDAEKYMSLIPEAGIKYITKEYDVTEKAARRTPRGVMDDKTQMGF